MLCNIPLVPKSIKMLLCSNIEAARKIIMMLKQYLNLCGYLWLLGIRKATCIQMKIISKYPGPTLLVVSVVTCRVVLNHVNSLNTVSRIDLKYFSFGFK